MNTLPHITNKQALIITLLFSFRFLDRTHIQKLLSHKDEARINQWLKDLTQKNYLSRKYTSTFPENTKPAIYHLAHNGIAFLKTQHSAEAQKLYRENKRSDSFISTRLLLADIYLDLKDKSRDATQFAMFVQSDFATHDQGKLLQELSPSAYIEQNTDGQTKHYFVDILSDLPLEILRKRIKQIITFYQGSEWEAATGQPFPTVLLICPDDTLLATIKRFAKTRLKQLDELDIKLHLTTAKSAKEQGITGDIWQPVTYTPYV